MASLVKKRCQTRELQKQHGKDIDQQEIGSQQMIQQEKIDEQENFNQVERVSGQGKKEQRVCMVNGKTLAANKTLKDSADLRPITNHQDRVVERNTSKKNEQIKTLISPGSLGLVQENEAFQILDEHVSEGEKDSDPKEIENDVFEIENESRPLQEEQDDQPGKGKKVYVPLKAKKTRGPSLFKDVHDLTTNNRSPIILNGSGQPIGQIRLP
ncbi:hypothetical protein PHJA_002481200 [Phtheirospermum japonicum]|uniref:Uncharacterized protein n=1 Tax=Phtheirospermum japonicum TaxID=374723 RepID=A0A830D550_9LAMI|nr:hypothetical protein PHJA_002481200 [Phtheirospermum japonicum]